MGSIKEFLKNKWFEILAAIGIVILVFNINTTNTDSNKELRTILDKIITDKQTALSTENDRLKKVNDSLTNNLSRRAESEVILYKLLDKQHIELDKIKGKFDNLSADSSKLLLEKAYEQSHPSTITHSK